METRKESASCEVAAIENEDYSNSNPNPDPDHE